MSTSASTLSALAAPATRALASAPPGTELDVTGLICLDIDVDLCLDIICTGGTCDQGTGTCTCPPGTELDITGLICLDIDVDLCLDIICTGGTCDQGTGTCTCPPGTLLDITGL